MKRLEKKKQLLEVLLLLLPVLIVVWVRSGRGMPERWMFLAFSAYYLGYMLWRARRRGVKRWILNLLRDPVLYCGSGLVALLGVQLWNSGRELVFNRDLWKWEYGSPPHLGWPSAVNAVEAQQWLFVVLMVVLLILAVRSLSFSRYQYRWMLKVLLYNAVLLALFGLIQYLTGTKKQYGFHFLPGYFFSVFGYPISCCGFFCPAVWVGLWICGRLHAPPLVGRARGCSSCC